MPNSTIQCGAKCAVLSTQLFLNPSVPLPKVGTLLPQTTVYSTVQWHPALFSVNFGITGSEPRQYYPECTDRVYCQIQWELCCGVLRTLSFVLGLLRGQRELAQVVLGQLSKERGHRHAARRLPHTTRSHPEKKKIKMVSPQEAITRGENCPGLQEPRQEAQGQYRYVAMRYKTETLYRITILPCMAYLDDLDDSTVLS